ncbi:MAG: hypothetical protein EOP06_31280, partial [Proteobacteria bacterium]
MKTWKLSSIILASSMALSLTAEARGGGSGVLFDVNLYYGSTKTDMKQTTPAETKTESTTALYDIKLGYLAGTGIYLGGIYTSRSNSVLNASGESGTAYGGSLGYFGSSGFFVMGHYIASATLGHYTEGKGMQVDFGYKAGVGGDWLVGGEITYR